MRDSEAIMTIYRLIFSWGFDDPTYHEYFSNFRRLHEMGLHTHMHLGNHSWGKIQMSVTLYYEKETKRRANRQAN